MDLSKKFVFSWMRAPIGLVLFLSMIGNFTGF